MPINALISKADDLVGLARYVDEVGGLGPYLDDLNPGLRPRFQHDPSVPGGGRPLDVTLSYGTNTGNTGDNAGILRDNLREAGMEIPPGYAAHHIVPSTYGRIPSAQEARQLLYEFDIDINDAVNGVLLTHPGQHSGLHTYRYIDAIRDDLLRVETHEDVIELLVDIAARLSEGLYP